MTFLFVLKKLLIRELDLFANIIGEAPGERDDLRDGIVLRNKALNMVINNYSISLEEPATELFVTGVCEDAHCQGIIWGKR